MLYKETLKVFHNRETVQEIINNMDFVDKYVDRVEENKFEIERTILYRQLGSMVYAAIEALLKLIVEEIGLRCPNKDLRCEYCKRKYLSNKYGVLSVIDHLNATRLIYINPQDKSKIYILKEKRNEVHLYRSKNKKADIVSINYVNDLFKVFGELIWQISINDWFFKKGIICLSEMDENEYTITMRMNKQAELEQIILDSYDIIQSLAKEEKISNEACIKLKMIFNCYEQVDKIAKAFVYALYYMRRNVNKENYREIVDNVFAIINKINGINIDSVNNVKIKVINGLEKEFKK